MAYSKYDTPMNQLRIQNSFTLVDLASYYDLSPWAVSRYYTGDFAELPEDVVTKTCELFDLDAKTCKNKFLAGRSTFLSNRDVTPTGRSDAYESDPWWTEKLKAQKLTPQALADKLGVDKTTIRSWYTQRSNPMAKYIYPLAKALKVSVSEVLLHIRDKNVYSAWWIENLGRNNLTPRDVADYLGYKDPTSVHAWVRKQFEPRNKETINAICNLFGTTYEDYKNGINGVVPEPVELKGYDWWANLLKVRGVTIEELCAIFEKDETSINNWFRGNTLPKMSEIALLAKFLDITVLDVNCHLRGGEKIEKPARVVKKDGSVKEIEVTEVPHVIEPVTAKPVETEPVKTPAMRSVAPEKPSNKPAAVKMDSKPFILSGVQKDVAEALYGKVDLQFFLNSITMTKDELLDTIFATGNRELYNQIFTLFI